MYIWPYIPGWRRAGDFDQYHLLSIYSLFSLLQALYAGLERGDQCDLRLVCVVSKYGDENLRHTEFMRGIKTLAVLRKNFKAYQLAMALKTGRIQIYK